MFNLAIDSKLRVCNLLELTAMSFEYIEVLYN